MIITIFSLVSNFTLQFGLFYVTLWNLSWKQNHFDKMEIIWCKHRSIFKDYRYHAFPNTEFSYFLTIDTRQYELLNYLLKIGGHWPLKSRYNVICKDVIFH